MGAVKIVSGPGKDAPKPVNKAVIDGQGSIPYACCNEIPTPKASKGSCGMGKARGMGAAMRGGSFHNC